METVLIVEKNTRLREKLSAIISSEKRTRCVILSPEFARMENALPQLGVNLLMMNISEGLVLKERIAGIKERLPGAKVILYLGAGHDDGYTELAGELGADGFVSLAGPCSNLAELLSRAIAGPSDGPDRCDHTGGKKTQVARR